MEVLAGTIFVLSLLFARTGTGGHHFYTPSTFLAPVGMPHLCNAEDLIQPQAEAGRCVQSTQAVPLEYLSLEARGTCVSETEIEKVLGRLSPPGDPTPD